MSLLPLPESDSHDGAVPQACRNTETTVAVADAPPQPGDSTEA